MNALTAIMFPVLAFFEITRLSGFRKTGKVCVLPDKSHANMMSKQCISRTALQSSLEVLPTWRPLHHYMFLCNSGHLPSCRWLDNQLLLEQCLHTYKHCWQRCSTQYQLQCSYQIMCLILTLSQCCIAAICPQS